MKKHTLNIRKDDTVVVISGEDKGKRGKVIRVLPDEGKVIVQGIHMIKKHQRPTASVREGGIVERESPIYESKIMVICPNCDSPTRVSHKRTEDGMNIRVCKKCGESIDKV
jgi:large subunit ribosomal protein L24